MVLLTTWPDHTPGSWLQGEAAERGKGALLPTVGLPGAALQKEGPKSGGSRSKGAVGAWRNHTHLGGEAEAAEQVFGQGDFLVPRDTGGAGTDCVVPSGLRVICQLGVE